MESRLLVGRSRPILTLAAVVALFGGCHAGRPGRPTTASSAVSTNTAAAATTTLPAAGGPSATEPPVGSAKLASILLNPADLPGGFTAGAATDTGGDVVSLRLCGQAAVSTAGAETETREVLLRSRDDLRLVEQLDGFASAGAAAVPVAALRALAQGCRQTGLTVIQPPAVGEDVAGLQLAAATGVVEVAVIRSGPIVAVVLLAAPRPILAATLSAVVQAAGTDLAVGTGG